MLDQKQYLNLGTKLVIRTILIVLALWLLYLVRDILALFFLSVILTATLDPAIDWMQKKRIPRPVGLTFIYVLLFSTLSLLISFLVPPFFSQLKLFSENLPVYSESLTHAFSGIELYASSYGIEFNSHEFLVNLFGDFNQSSTKIFSTTVGVFTVFISLVVVLSLTFYMSVKEDGMKKFIVSLTPLGKQDYIVSLVERIKGKIGKWLFGQLFLMVGIFILDFVALSIFNIPYALILAILAGLLEIVPYLGPIISATLAAMVGFIISPLTGVVVLAILTVIQQVESHIIVPQIMKKAVGLNPVAVILALLIGAKLGGTIGAILAVPLATAMGIFVLDMVNKKETN